MVESFPDFSYRDRESAIEKLRAEWQLPHWAAFREGVEETFLSVDAPMAANERFEEFADLACEYFGWFDAYDIQDMALFAELVIDDLDFTERERLWLTRVMDSSWRLYEVTEKGDEHILLSDMLEDEEVSIRYTVDDFEPDLDQVVVARVIAGGRGEPELDGPTFWLTPELSTPLPRLVTEQMQEIGRSWPGSTETQQLKQVSPFFFYVWVTQIETWIQIREDREKQSKKADIVPLFPGDVGPGAGSNTDDESSADDQTGEALHNHNNGQDERDDGQGTGERAEVIQLFPGNNEETSE